MPFVQRVVSPIYIARSTRASRQHLQPDATTSSTTTVIHQSITTSTTSSYAEAGYSGGGISHNCISVAPQNGVDSVKGVSASGNSVKISPVNDYELESVTNLTLSNALKQLASLVLIANDIFTELNKELQKVGERSNGIKSRLDGIGRKVDEFDPKLVTVPESDLETFVQIKNHFKSKQSIYTSLFTPSTRSETLQQLYDAAAKTPVSVMREMDRILGQDDRSSSDIFLCTPVLGQTRKRMKTNIDVEIETGMPAAVGELRKWTSLEAIGDITVTPDCIARVGFNSNLNSTLGNTTSATTPAGTSSADETDDVTLISNSKANDHTLADMPLDHRLPSPEEQCQILALKYPAELIRVDTSGRRFDRMSHTRKSLLHVQMNVVASPESSSSPQQGDSQTVKRRSRSRKPRGKRRNTLAGTDQKEIEEAANGNPEAVILSPSDIDDISVAVPRSKSSDILKKESPLSSDSSRTLAISSHFNTLKQWGMNRLRLMNRNNDEKKEAKVSDIDDINVYETIGSRNRRKLAEKERKLSHERKPSYSSSEKSLTITSQSSQSTLPASINPVKLRESSAIRRQRRLGLGYKEEPNSSSGNWSASSESGRTSIGSEITVQPKSSASSNSLNHTLHPGSGPPSSIISRRRFLNTSASSSVTSEGTATPDLQMHEMYDDETSSAYSCDTEGYYTSFHVDSGLKTLKEEEPVTPLHTSSALSSTNSFGSSGNQTVLSAENEYELFGKGSTSTTTSSAGTVCTTLMAAGSDRSLIIGPAVPERKSSLTKLNRSNSTNSGGTLERSYSSSTSVGSTLERTGTIKRNGILIQKEVAVIVHQHKQEQKENRTESPDSGNNTSSSPVESNSNSSPTQGVRSYSEFEYSESSDLEGVDRIERIRSKTTINSSRIPSLCVITPSNSDDEYQTVVNKINGGQTRPKIEIPKSSEEAKSGVHETDLDAIVFNTESKKMNNEKIQIISVNQNTGYATVQTLNSSPILRPQQQQPPATVVLKKEVQHVKKTTLLPLNSMLGRLRGVLPTLKKSPNKENIVSFPDPADDPIYDASGEYVTIADVTNNNKKQTTPSGIYYNNDVLKRNLATVLSGNLNEETEYVSLNELPSNIRCESNLLVHSIITPMGEKKIDNSPQNTTENDMNKDEEGINRRGARVTLDAQGKVIYSSDSLKRRKGAHTTFAPGPCVKDTTTTTSPSTTTSSSLSLQTPSKALPSTSLISGGVSNRKPAIIRPVPAINPARKLQITTEQNLDTIQSPIDNNEVRKLEKNQDTVNLYESQITQSSSAMLPIGSTKQGAYVNMQSSVSQRKENVAFVGNQPSTMQGYRHFYHDDEVDTVPSQITTIATLPRQGNVESNTEAFQRNNSMYWTLQARRPPAQNTFGNNGNASMQARDNFEELYSTPNKDKRNKLKTTPLGFSTFFSPIGPKQPGAGLDDSNLKISPIDPRNTGNGIKTSTPAKSEEKNLSPTKSVLSEELRQKLRLQEEIRSTGSSPSNSGRSTLRGILEPQGRGRHSWASDAVEIPQTCSDRLGTPKTSLMDFKKLLLAKAGKSVTVTKPSAVEQLLINKGEKSPKVSPPSVINSSMKIQDLSGSPKTFASRRMIRQGNFGSPSKTISGSGSVSKHHMSPRANWRLNNTMKHDVMSTAIPEANSEEDNSSPNNSSRRSSSQSQGSPKGIKTSFVTVANKEENNVIEENVNIKDNIFMKAEENNFMKHELLQKNQSFATSRSQMLQAQRTQFLMGNRNNNNNTVQQPIISAQFKNGHYTGISSSILGNKEVIGRIRDMPIKSTESNSPTNSTEVPSLETAL